MIDERELVQTVMRLWQEDAKALFERLATSQPEVYARGVAALTGPDDSVQRKAFLEELGAAQTPEEWQAVIQRRAAIVGQAQVAKEMLSRRVP